MNPVSSLLIFFSIVGSVIAVLKIYQSSWFVQNFMHSRKELIEDILKQLFHVQQSGKFASFMAMSGALKISHKRLVKLVDEMTDSGLIRIENEKLILTNEGKEYALRIVRVHRLWEKYLSEKTGFGKREWHDLAEKKEHLLSKEEVKALSQSLGNPRFDPHGDPIPTESGEIFKPDWKPLPSIEESATARIVHIEDEPSSIYRQILQKKLTIGSQLKVIQNQDHQIIIESEGFTHHLSPIVASNINVSYLNEQEIYEQNAVRLSSLQPGEYGNIIGLSSECRGANRRRLLDLGFVNGSQVEVALENPLKEPKAYNIRNTLVALRNDQADYIIIEKVAEHVS